VTLTQPAPAPAPDLGVEPTPNVLCPAYLPSGCTRVATSAGVKSCCDRALIACEPCRESVAHILGAWWLQQYGTRPPCRCGGTTDDIAWRPL
jgi:hypothetical protein